MKEKILILQLNEIYPVRGIVYLPICLKTLEGIKVINVKKQIFKS